MRDWAGLFILVLAYFTVRPYLVRGAKSWFRDDALKEGEQAQAEFLQSKAKIGPNTIRDTTASESTSIPERSGDTTTGSKVHTGGKVTNRRAKETTGTEEILNWDDQHERKPVEGDKGDVVAWMDKWSNEE